METTEQLPKQPADNAMFLEEYKLKWSYYNNTIDERKNLFDWYFKIVTIPASAFGLTNILSKNLDNSPFRMEDYGTVFLIIFLCGLGLFVSYCISTGNAHRYLDRLRHLELILMNTEYEPKPKSQLGFLLTVGFWRTTPIIFINSFIFSLYYYFLHIGTLHAVKIIFILTVIIHCSFYTILYNIGTAKQKMSSK